MSWRRLAFSFPGPGRTPPAARVRGPRSDSGHLTCCGLAGAGCALDSQTLRAHRRARDPVCDRDLTLPWPVRGAATPRGALGCKAKACVPTGVSPGQGCPRQCWDPMASWTSRWSPGRCCLLSAPGEQVGVISHRDLDVSKETLRASGLGPSCPGGQHRWDQLLLPRARPEGLRPHARQSLWADSDAGSLRQGGLDEGQPTCLSGAEQTNPLGLPTW